MRILIATDAAREGLNLQAQGAERLHEELVPVATRWTEPSRRQGPLRAYAREAEARTLSLLDESRNSGGPTPNEIIQCKLENAAPRDIAALRPQLESRAQEFADIAKRRRDQFDRDLEREPERIREFYEVRAQRVEPVGLVYLWPETN